MALTKHLNLVGCKRKVIASWSLDWHSAPALFRPPLPESIKSLCQEERARHARWIVSEKTIENIQQSANRKKWKDKNDLVSLLKYAEEFSNGRPIATFPELDTGATVIYYQNYIKDISLESELQPPTTHVLDGDVVTSPFIHYDDVRKNSMISMILTVS